jgi:hypothetical protein
MQTVDDYMIVNKGVNDAIAELGNALHGKRLEVPQPPYDELVYRAAWKLVEWCKTAEADLEQYKVELERRRQIGLTIDPATAETTFWWPDINDPYWILGEKHHDGCYGRTYFARNPGAGPDDWVHFNDLPEATCDALWERDRRRLAFPYGMYATHPDEVINKPPLAGS